MNNILELMSVAKTYFLQSETIEVLKNINLSVKQGDFVGIFGPSGSGKSTLLNIIGSLDAPTSGRVLLDGIELFTHRDAELSLIRNSKIGFVFQFHHLLPEFTCVENIALPALVRGTSPGRAHERAQELLDRFGMSDKGGRLPEQLSGGEKQRVAIARALINDPRIILADEPTGNLDYENTAKLLEVFVHLKSEGHTIILVTHSLDIEQVATNVYNLKDGALDVM
ncbi:ABC transporter ATP-binding protein [candidate division WOR-3 bacterium]|nr:ABC transporter ATP-binding protein [candidate division WOR-3 bacterium]